MGVGLQRCVVLLDERLSLGASQPELRWFVEIIEILARIHPQVVLPKDLILENTLPSACMRTPILFSNLSSLLQIGVRSRPNHAIQPLLCCPPWC